MNKTSKKHVKLLTRFTILLLYDRNLQRKTNFKTRTRPNSFAYFRLTHYDVINA